MLEQKYTGVIRHAIEFYGLKPTLPYALRNFRSYTYNPEKGRISFITASGTGFQKLRTIYSTDPDIQKFNKIFSDANKNLDWNKIKSYDFADKAATPLKQNTNPSPNPPSPTPNPSPNKKDDLIIQKDDSNMLPFIIAAGVISFIFLKSKKGKRK